MNVWSLATWLSAKARRMDTYRLYNQRLGTFGNNPSDQINSSSTHSPFLDARRRSFTQKHTFGFDFVMLAAGRVFLHADEARKVGQDQDSALWCQREQ